MDIDTIANRLNGWTPFFLRNHGRCRGGAYKPKHSFGERHDAKSSGDIFDAKRALLRKDWAAAQRALEKSIDDNPLGTNGAAILCDQFDKGEMALELVRYGEKRCDPSRFGNLRNILADAHLRHYKTCHRARDKRLAKQFRNA